jgi:hypothetical protein
MGGLRFGPIPWSVIDDEHRSNRQRGHNQRDYAGMAKR